MQHRVKLHTFRHSADALEQEGCNQQLVTCAAVNKAAVRTSHTHVHLYRLSAGRAVSSLPAALLPLAGALKPADLKLYQSLDLRAYGNITALAAGMHG